MANLLNNFTDIELIALSFVMMLAGIACLLAGMGFAPMLAVAFAPALAVGLMPTVKDAMARSGTFVPVEVDGTCVLVGA